MLAVAIIAALEVIALAYVAIELVIAYMLPVLDEHGCIVYDSGERFEAWQETHQVEGIQ